MRLSRLIQILAFFASVHSANLCAQNLGPLLPPGQSPNQSAILERYSLNFAPQSPLSATRIVRSLDALQSVEAPLRLRGAKEVELYRTLAASVTLVLLEDRSGSGSLLDVSVKPGSTARTGSILTNSHVVGTATEVGIIFKPQLEGQAISAASVLRGRVRKMDPLHDLALVEVVGVPTYVAPIELGTMSEVQVGADVHAIGHPNGEAWTYTKGLISQIRTNYEWQSQSDVKHKADVIQTQTPINPGNSGGPLISDSGHLIGINSFKESGEALNFAVSVGEVRKFLAAAAKGSFDIHEVSAAATTCDGKVVYEGRNARDDAFIKNIDLECSGRVDGMLYVPDDKTKPIEFRVDSNHDGKVDIIFFDTERKGKWNYSLWDTDFDGKPDLIGYHPDGELKPSRFEKYPPKS